MSEQPKLPQYTQFEYVWVTLETGEQVVEVWPYKCEGYDEEEDSFVWVPQLDNFVQFDTEDQALRYINQHGVLAESFKNKLN